MGAPLDERARFVVEVMVMVDVWLMRQPMSNTAAQDLAALKAVLFPNEGESDVGPPSG